MMVENWKTFKLGDLIEVQNGYAFKTEEFADKGTPIIKIKNITPPRISFNDTVYYNGNIDDKLKPFVIRKNDILISLTGSNFNQIASAVGKVGKYKYDFPSLLNQRVGKLYSKNESFFNDDFLYYFISRPETQIDLVSSAGGSGNQANISPKQIKNLDIKIPDVTTQFRIASILTSLDDKIELNLQMNKTLEAISQAIFKEWFVDFRFPGFDGELVDGLPKGWRSGKLGEIIKNFDSKRVPVSSQERAKRKGIYPYYGAASLMDYIDNYLFDGTFLLMGEDGSVIDDNGYPVLQYVWGKFWVNNHAHVIQGSDSFSTEYIYILLQRTQISNIVTGAVQPKINQGNLNGIGCTIPDAVSLKEFNKLVLPLFERVKVNHDENIILTSVRDTLLPKLMTGKIRVA